MPEKIGLQGILDLSDFTGNVNIYVGGMKRMRSETAASASAMSGHMGSASRATTGLGSAMQGITSWISGGAAQFVSLGTSVLKFGAIAGGVALAGVVALTAGIVMLGATALTEYAKYERMALSVQSLVARELSQGTLVEEQRQVLATLTAKEAEELDKLRLKIQEEGLERATQTARIQEQRQRLIQLTAAYGDNGLNVQTATARLAEMEFELVKSDAATAKMTARVGALSSKTGQLITVTEQVRTGQISMKDAMAAASPKAQELLHWIQELAIFSPFSEEGVSEAFRTAMAYGFVTERAQELVEVTTDYGAATGLTTDKLNLITLALGQMKAKGKVSAQELNQLTGQGIGANKILGDMGFTLDDVAKGLVPVDDMIQAVVDDMKVFEGAARQQSSTWSGMLNSLEDLKAIGLREFFAGTFQSAQPYIAQLIDTLTDPATVIALREWGVVLGTQVAGALANLIGLATTLSTSFQAEGTAGIVAALGLTPETMELIGKVVGSISMLSATLTGILLPSLSSLSEGGALAALNASISWLNENFVTLQAVLVGVAAVLGAAAIAAIIAGIATVLSLLVSPVGLIIAGVIALSAAWVNNWGNIQAYTYTAWAVLSAVFAGIVAAFIPISSSFSAITEEMAKLGISWGDVGSALLTATGYVAAGIGVLLLAIIGTVVSFASAWVAAGAKVVELLGRMLTSAELFVTGVLQLFQGDFVVGIQSIAAGLTQMMTLAFTGPFAIILAAFDGFGSAFVAFWVGLYNTLLGHSIVWDIVDGIVSAFQSLVQPVLDTITALAASASGLLSSILGGITGGGEGAAIDLSGLTTGLPQALRAGATAAQGLYASIQLLTVAANTTLPESFTVASLIIEAAILTWYAALLPFVTAVLLLQATQLPGLGAAGQATATVIVVAFAMVNAQLLRTQDIILSITAALQRLAANAATWGKQIADGLDPAIEALGVLAGQVSAVVSAFKQMKTHAEAAALAATAAGNAGTDALQGFTSPTDTTQQSGTGPMGMTVPQGYAHDSYRVGVSTGEQVFVARPNQSIEQLLARRLVMQQPRAAAAGVMVNVGPNTIQSPMDLNMMVRVLKNELAGAR